MRADAQRLQQQLATPDTLARVSEPALPLARTPAQAGYPVPFLSPAQQQHRAHERARARAQRRQQVLAAYNRAAQAPYLSPFLRKVLSQPRISMLKVEPAGPDSFMPPSFWQSQNPNNDPKVGWRQCCATVKKMVGYNAPPKDRIQIVLEHGRSLVLQPGAAAGLRMLDKYLALHKPVMTGVNHTYAAGYNEGTTDHFIAIVGTGTDARGKYYRFFDVGTTDIERGTHARNRLYYDARTESYSGKSMVNQKTYTISQLRFKPGTF